MDKTKVLFTTLAILSVALFIGLLVTHRESVPKDPQKRVLVLVIASDNHPVYLELQGIWRAYMHLDPKHVTAYFLKGDPDLKKASELKGDVLYTKVVDDYRPGILKKTLYSMEALSGKLKQYDYVVRTNLSSFYDFPKLLSFLETLPKERCYAAVARLPSYNMPPDLLSTPFGWGAGFILSPDLVKMMVDHKEELLDRSHTVPDDVLIGSFFHKRNIPIIPTACYGFQNRQEWLNAQNQLPRDIFHYRAKSHYDYRQLSDPYLDELTILSDLVNKFYPEVHFKRQFETAYPLNIKLLTLHEYHAAHPTDINEHLPTLRKLARESVSVTEIGLKTPQLLSSWALMQGLSENGSKKRKFVGVGESSPPFESLLLANKVATENGISFKFVRDNEMNLEIDKSDLLFIDSLHTYAHLTYLLEKLASKVNKYIALHDTSDPWGTRDDIEYRGDYSEYPEEIDRNKKGLWPAIVDFLERHPEWALKERWLNNHGLTVLKRVGVTSITKLGE